MKRLMLIALALPLAGCQSVQTTQPGAVGVQRPQNMLVSSEQINAGAQKAYTQTIQQAAQKGLLISAVGAAARVGDVAQNLAQAVLDLTFNLPHSRTDETEADRIGVELAARAGYDPRAAISLWQKMVKAGGGSPPQFLSTHPANATRIADLQVYSEKVLPLYQRR